MDSSGKTQPLHSPLGLYYTPRFSPDGKRLAFSIGNGQDSEDIWVKDLDRDTPSRLSFLKGQNRWPVWTPDGKNVVLPIQGPGCPRLVLDPLGLRGRSAASDRRQAPRDSVFVFS